MSEQDYSFRIDRSDDAREEIECVHYDFSEIKGAATRTDEGYIRGEAAVTRTGVFEYLNADGSSRFELRHPDDVFDRASLDSLKMIPMTNGHPPVRQVNRDNAQTYSIGAVGENVYPDGIAIMAPFQITHADGVKAVDGGRRGLSLGYGLALLREDGVYKGKRYDYRQTKIRYNHLALVDKARAGDIARINLDADDSVQTDEGDEMAGEAPKLTTVRLDSGIEYQASPEVAHALTAAQATITRQNDELAKLRKDGETITAERDTLKDKLGKLDSDDTKKTRADEITKAVKARVALVGTATKHLAKDLHTKLDGMSDDEIRKAVVLTAFPKAELDGKSADYLASRYDSALEMLSDDKSGLSRQRETALGNGGGTGTGTGTTNADAAPDPAKARKDMLESVTGAWKGKQGA